MAPPGSFSTPSGGTDPRGYTRLAAGTSVPAAFFPAPGYDGQPMVYLTLFFIVIGVAVGAGFIWMARAGFFGRRRAPRRLQGGASTREPKATFGAPASADKAKDWQ